MPNNQRAERAYRALLQAQYTTGNDIETAVIDLLTDLIHLSDEYSFSVPELLARASANAGESALQPTTTTAS